MKKLHSSIIVIMLTFFGLFGQTVEFQDDARQRGYYNRPYQRYEAELDKCTTNGSVLPASFDQTQIQSEASNQEATQLINKDSYVQWINAADADGMVIRFSIPDSPSGTGTIGLLSLYVDDEYIQDVVLNSYWAWQYFPKSNGNKDADNIPSLDKFPRMRFDEVQVKLSTPILANSTFRLQKKDDNADPYTIDFVELELIPGKVAKPAGAIEYTGNGSDFFAFVENNGGQTIYLPEGTYNVPSIININYDNTKIIGAGMWYTQINFSHNGDWNGGFCGRADNIHIDGIFLSTVNNDRYSSYKALNGWYGPGSVISNVWAEHFECGGWIGNYDWDGNVTDGLTVQYCRFRNNYADGINLCKGTKNSVVEYCSFRNNGDDDMASWSADNEECFNNTYQYSTAENNWRASSIGFFGGKQNKAQYCVVIDPMEAGLRATSDFGGAPYSNDGFTEFENISVYRGGVMAGVPGTGGDLWGNSNGAIQIRSSWAYDVRNIKFSNIDLYDSKDDGILLESNSLSTGMRSVYLTNISIDGTENDGIHFNENQEPRGIIFYCNIQYANIGSSNMNSVPSSLAFKQAADCQSPVKYTKKDEIIVWVNHGDIRVENMPIGKTLAVYDVLGKIKYHSVITESTETISSLSNGIYLICIDNAVVAKTLITNK